MLECGLTRSIKTSCQKCHLSNVKCEKNGIVFEIVREIKILLALILRICQIVYNELSIIAIYAPRALQR
jgi:hypothetical protein